MNKKLVLSLSILISIGAVYADTLELQNGDILEGSYRGGTAQTIRFQTAAGLQTVKVDQILALTFDGSGSDAPIAVPVATQPAVALVPATVSYEAVPVVPVAAARSEVVPAGTTLLVRMAHAVNSATHKPGHKFTAALEADLKAGNTVVAPIGTRVYGILSHAKQSRRIAGQSELVLELTEIRIDGELYPIATGNYESKSTRTGRRTARRALLGAAIGVAVDGSDGAKSGAAIGAGSSVLTRGRTVNVPGGTLIEFTLQTPFSPAL